VKRILLSEKIKKAPSFLTIEPYLRPQDKPVASHPEARQPRLAPLVVIDYGSFTARNVSENFCRKPTLERR
jgi:hypothetical protein